jgi:reverse gyrase
LGSILSHFSKSNIPAIISMPTGSGKSALIYLAPFVLNAKRMLIVVPSRSLYKQIEEDFKKLKTLKKLDLIDAIFPLPKVTIIKNRIKNKESMEKLKKFDVCISTPKTISPIIKDIFPIDKDIFDLIIVDE